MNAMQMNAMQMRDMKSVEGLRGACRRALLSACLLMLPFAAPAQERCDKQPVAPERIEMVGRDMLINGLESTVTAVTLPGSSQDVSAAFRDFWSREDVPAKGRSLGASLALSALDGDCFYLLQLPRQSTAEAVRGILSVTRLTPRARQHQIRAEQVALPAGGRTLSDIESRDIRQTGRTWVLDVPGRGKEGMEAYQRRLAGEGWRLVAQAPAYALDGSNAVNGHALAMQRGKISARRGVLPTAAPRAGPSSM